VVDRRTRATLADGSAWNYDYNDRSEVTGGKRYWGDFAPVAGQQFEFAYDHIGNRSTARFGGDTNGANLRVITYQTNNLNQYTSITTLGYRDIFGAIGVRSEDSRNKNKGGNPRVASN
jgi:hypothetical protein